MTDTATALEEMRKTRTELVVQVLTRMADLGLYGALARVLVDDDPGDSDTPATTVVSVTKLGRKGAFASLTIDANANIWNVAGEEATATVSSHAVLYGFLTGEVSAPVVRG